MGSRSDATGEVQPSRDRRVDVLVFPSSRSLLESVGINLDTKNLSRYKQTPADRFVHWNSGRENIVNMDPDVQLLFMVTRRYQCTYLLKDKMA